MSSLRTKVVALIGLVVTLAVGCSSLEYAIQESVFGNEKRDILASRVEDGRDDQQEAKEQFKSALEAFRNVVSFDGGSLEDAYETLSDEFERCEARAEDVRDRIDSIEDVAAALFAEWEAEIATFDNASRRATSEQMLRDTKSRYAGLITAMQKAEDAMEPVLDEFREQVLFLKHSLNAQAIAALEDSVVEIESDVARLIEDMEASIAEAESFLSTLS